MLVSRRLALLVSVLPLVACGSPKVLMRFHPKAATYRFVMQEDMKGSLSGGAGSASMPVGEASVGGEFNEAIGGPRDGGIGVIWTIDTLTVKSPQEMAARAESTLAARVVRIKAMSFDVVYDDRMIPMKEQVNDPTGVSGHDPDAPGALRSAAHSFAFPLPREPLGKGDTWRAADDLALPGVTDASAVQVQYELTVKDIVVNGADTSVVIGITAKFPDTPLPLTIQGVRLQAKLSGSTTGEETFSLTQGALMTGTLNGAVKVELTIPTLTTPIAMSYDVHVTMKRAGP